MNSGKSANSARKRGLAEMLAELNKKGAGMKKKHSHVFGKETFTFQPIGGKVSYVSYCACGAKKERVVKRGDA